MDMHTKSSRNKMTKLSILAIAATMVFLTQVALAENAQGLTRFDNCVTRNANNHGTLSLADVERCYDSVFQGALDNDADGRPLR
jgi:hypothetical protein